MNTFLFTKIELWSVEKLIPYDRNARTHSDEQIERIARSIQEFGFTNPILVDTGAGILATVPIGSSPAEGPTHRGQHRRMPVQQIAVACDWPV